MKKSLVILAFYLRLNDDSISEQEKFETKKHSLYNMASRFANSDITEDVNILVFPTSVGEDRIECVYPKFVMNEDMHAQFEQSINDFMDIVKKFGEQNGNNSNS